MTPGDDRLRVPPHRVRERATLAVPGLEHLRAGRGS